MLQDEKPEIIDEDRIAIPEARIIKFKGYLWDLLDANDELMDFWRTGKEVHLMKADFYIIRLWSKLKIEYQRKEIKAKEKFFEKLEYFRMHRNIYPNYNMAWEFWYELQWKLKKMKVWDITFPEADIGSDFRRSW